MFSLNFAWHEMLDRAKARTAMEVAAAYGIDSTPMLHKLMFDNPKRVGPVRQPWSWALESRNGEDDLAMFREECVEDAKWVINMY